MKKIFTGILASVALVAAFVSCSSVGVHADVIGFNDDVDTSYKFYDLEKNGQIKKLDRVIQKFKPGQNTAEYYAVDIALDRIAEIAKKADEDSRASYYLILLTDGLDNVSVEMAKRNGRGKYLNDDEYALALKKRMETILDTKRGKHNSRNIFQAYPLMIYGKDLMDSDLTINDCKEILSKIAGAQNAEEPKPIVDSSTDKILEEFKKTFVVASFSFEVPKGFVGKRIQMKFECFDKDGRRHEVAVDADFECQTKKKKETYILKNISCSEGLDFDQKLLSQMVSDEDYDGSENLVSFTFSNIKYNKNPSTVYNPTQWYKLNGKYVKNSEYTGKTDRKTDSYILFVLDTSSSLGDSGREDANATAIEIIKYIKDEISSH